MLSIERLSTSKTIEISELKVRSTTHATVSMNIYKINVYLIYPITKVNQHNGCVSLI